MRAGKFRAIATTSPTRLKIASDAPTISVAGVSGFDSLGWQGISAPAGTPPAVPARWSSELIKILEMPAAHQKLDQDCWLIRVLTATVLCAAVLHKNIEDTETTESEMTTSFGSDVLSVFLEVIDDKLLEIS